MNTVDWHPPLRPFGMCKRDAEGNCLGKCGRPGHLGRALTIEEWMFYFGRTQMRVVDPRAKEIK